MSRVEDFLDDNGKPDLFEENPHDYFHFPCSGCAKRCGDQSVCSGCRHWIT